jgi:hypothetical protein
MEILELSAARELSTEMPMDSRIAALKNKNVIHKTFFIPTS